MSTENEQKLRLALGVLIDLADMLIAKNLPTIVYLKPSVRILVRDHIKKATKVYDATKPKVGKKDWIHIVVLCATMIFGFAYINGMLIQREAERLHKLAIEAMPCLDSAALEEYNSRPPVPALIIRGNGQGEGLYLITNDSTGVKR